MHIIKSEKESRLSTEELMLFFFHLFLLVGG